MVEIAIHGSLWKVSAMIRSITNQAAAVPDGWQKDERPAIPAHARSVWEVHVADFTADPASGVPQAYRGKFMGFTVDGTTLNGDGVHPTGLNYLKRLGVTHVQLQPIFDFATVDEVSGEDYNWGYDPLNYNLPEGSYATDAFHGEVRVRECRAMVQALHSAETKKFILDKYRGAVVPAF